MSADFMNEHADAFPEAVDMPEVSPSYFKAQAARNLENKVLSMMLFRVSD